MTYTRPSYQEELNRITADLADVPAPLRARLSAALAKMSHGQYSFLDWVHAQCSPLTCDEDRLKDWAELYKVPRLDAVQASGFAVVAGTVGTAILRGVELRGQNGLDYVVESAATLGAGNTNVSIKCVDAGAAGNLVSGQTLTLIDPIPGCASVWVVEAAGVSGGAEQESVDAWRARVCDEWQVVTKYGGRSGKVDDYRFWAKSAHPSVTGALVYPHALGQGTVLVRPICNGLLNRLPTQSVLDAVAAVLYVKAPATADWKLAAPLVKPVVVSLHLLAGFDTQANRDAINVALNSAVLAESSENSSLAVAEADAAVASVTTQYNRISPTDAVSVGVGEVLVLQPVVWS